MRETAVEVDRRDQQRKLRDEQPSKGGDEESQDEDSGSRGDRQIHDRRTPEHGSDRGQIEISACSISLVEEKESPHSTSCRFLPDFLPEAAPKKTGMLIGAKWSYGFQLRSVVPCK